MVKFAVHTNKGRFIVDAKTPDEARNAVLKKYPNILIGKVKVTPAKG